ncbi:MAG: hypothetical protein ACW981_18505 [Candidatus Hodarchaeales archaeon]|jgi:hypothetical protein
MSVDSEEELKQTIAILKKVENWEKSNEYTKFLFIIAIIGLIAIFEGLLSYLIGKYVETDITSVYIGAKSDDPILLVGVWIIQISLIGSLLIYSQTGKGILDTWTPYIRKLAVVWGIMYVLSFIINVGLIFTNEDNFGPFFWAIDIAIAFFISIIILKPLENTKNIRTGLGIIGLVTLLIGIIILFLPPELTMLTLGMTVGILLLLLAGLNYWKI